VADANRDGVQAPGGVLLLRKLLLLLPVAGVACCHLSCGNIAAAFDPASIELGIQGEDPPYALTTNTQYFLTVTVRNGLGADDTDRFYHDVTWVTVPPSIATVRSGGRLGWILETTASRGSCSITGALGSHPDIRDAFTITIP